MIRGFGNDYIVQAVRRQLAVEAKDAALECLADIRRRGRDGPRGSDAAMLVRTSRDEPESPP